MTKKTKILSYFLLLVLFFNPFLSPLTGILNYYSSFVLEIKQLVKANKERRNKNFISPENAKELRVNKVIYQCASDYLGALLNYSSLVCCLENDPVFFIPSYFKRYQLYIVFRSFKI